VAVVEALGTFVVRRAVVPGGAAADVVVVAAVVVGLVVVWKGKEVRIRNFPYTLLELTIVAVAAAAATYLVVAVVVAWVASVTAPHQPV
jgi:hypothetical protein